jgi:hypothetical protein
MVGATWSRLVAVDAGMRGISLLPVRGRIVPAFLPFYCSSVTVKVSPAFIRATGGSVCTLPSGQRISTESA